MQRPPGSKVSSSTSLQRPATSAGRSSNRTRAAKSPHAASQGGGPASASAEAGTIPVVPEECVADKHESPHFANLYDIAVKYGDVVPVAEVPDHLRGWNSPS